MSNYKVVSHWKLNQQKPCKVLSFVSTHGILTAVRSVRVGPSFLGAIFQNDRCKYSIVFILETTHPKNLILDFGLHETTISSSYFFAEVQDSWVNGLWLNLEASVCIICVGEEMLSTVPIYTRCFLNSLSQLISGSASRCWPVALCRPMWTSLYSRRTGSWDWAAIRPPRKTLTLTWWMLARRLSRCEPEAASSAATTASPWSAGQLSIQTFDNLPTQGDRRFWSTVDSRLTGSSSTELRPKQR